MGFGRWLGGPRRGAGYELLKRVVFGRATLAGQLVLVSSQQGWVWVEIERSVVWLVGGYAARRRGVL